MATTDRMDEVVGVPITAATSRRFITSTAASFQRYEYEHEKEVIQTSRLRQHMAAVRDGSFLHSICTIGTFLSFSAFDPFSSYGLGVKCVNNFSFCTAFSVFYPFETGSGQNQFGAATKKEIDLFLKATTKSGAGRTSSG